MGLQAFKFQTEKETFFGEIGNTLQYGNMQSSTLLVDKALQKIRYIPQFNFFNLLTKASAHNSKFKLDSFGIVCATIVEKELETLDEADASSDELDVSSGNVEKQGKAFDELNKLSKMFLEIIIWSSMNYFNCKSQNLRIRDTLHHSCHFSSSLSKNKVVSPKQFVSWLLDSEEIQFAKHLGLFWVRNVIDYMLQEQRIQSIWRKHFSSFLSKLFNSNSEFLVFPNVREKYTFIVISTNFQNLNVTAYLNDIFCCKYKYVFPDPKNLRIVLQWVARKLLEIDFSMLDIDWNKLFVIICAASCTKMNKTKRDALFLSIIKVLE